MATLTPTFEDFLPDWVARQRWYRGKSAGPEGSARPRLRRIASIRWEDPFGEVGMEDHIVVDESGPEPVVYQIPLTYRAEPVDFMAAGLVTTAEHSELGTRYVYDATHDPVFAQTLLEHMHHGTDVPSARARRAMPQTGDAEDTDVPPALASSRVLAGEQSNTSVVVEQHRGAPPVILKVFRVLQSGQNPDVEVQTAIAGTGSTQVPRPIGYLEGRWPDGQPGETRGHLVFAQEFLPGTQDAWVTALHACRAEEDFTDRARSLGAATAEVHTALRESFSTTPAAGRLADLVDAMRRRADEAFGLVPDLAPHAAAVSAVYDRLAAEEELPELQRVHGDYHLGQVLDVPDRGWVLLDFEGEPLRPLAERVEPDLALRDVAGMLRSFDYAVASVQLAGEGDRTGWAQNARAAFLDGYAQATGADLADPAQRRLLDALELDKALYEVTYEARNRPNWVTIPVQAVQRLLGVPATPATTFPSTRAATDGSPTEGGPVTPPSSSCGQDHASDQGADLTGPGGYAAAGDESGEAPAGRLDQPLAQEEPGEPAAQGGQDAAVAPVGQDEPATQEGHDGPAGQGEPAEQGVEVLEDEPAWGPAWDESNLVPSGTPASGGVPHAPIPPPLEMTEAADVPQPTGLEVGLVPPTGRGRVVSGESVTEPGQRPPASGWAGGPVGDPEKMRAAAWEDAAHSPDIVTGVAGSAGTAGRGGAAGAGDATTATRAPLEPPAGPVPPHTRPLDLDEATDVVHGLHRNPHTLLGAHPHEGHTTFRTLQPDADAVDVVLPGGRNLPMTPETGGIWVAVLPERSSPAYRLKVASEGRSYLVDEVYRHGPSLGETDLHLIGEGRHEQLWRALGSHVITVRDELGEVTGTRFAVWAPNAQAVHVIGDFNGWNGATHALRAHDSVGVWELFVPGVREGAHYKYDITGPDGVRRAKADPMARATEVPPFTNSVVTRSRHQWQDGEWMAAREAGDIHHGPMSIYEVHLTSWRQGRSYEQLADELVRYVSDMGFTHVELMPVMQHPYGGSWGYHVTGYYAADSRFGHEDGLRHLIDRLHQAGIGVILDWVPGHFATDPWALARFDGTPIYEHPDPRKGWHPEWGSYIFDFGRNEVRNFLVANATYWLEEFHADGLRVDGVASMLYLDYSRSAGQWVPNRYGGRENLEAVTLLQEANATAYRRSPGVVLIAEESTSWPGVTAPTDEGGLGFGFKWNMGWMHDTLGYLGQEPYSRAHSHHALTFSLVYAFSEKYILPVSHDEVVHGKGSLLRKMAGDAWQKFATTRAFLAYQWSHPGKQLLFMGSEFAQEREWADQSSLNWELTERPEHAGVQRLVRDLNRLYQEHPALWQIDHHEDGFAWLEANDASRNQYSYLRWGNESPDGLRPVVAVIVNFSGLAHHQVHVGLPYGGRWREVLNTDAEVYGGSGQGNLGYIEAYDHEHQRQPFSALVMVPPMSAVWLVPDPEDEVVVAGELADDEPVEVGQADEAVVEADETDESDEADETLEADEAGEAEEAVQSDDVAAEADSPADATDALDTDTGTDPEGTPYPDPERDGKS